MNPPSVKEAVALASSIKNGVDKSRAEVVICPPSVFLSDVSRAISKSSLKLGAQDCFCEECGPFTGEISPAMLKSFSVKYVIIGHSERRSLGEDNALINKKAKALLKKGMKVVLCVGESARDAHGDYLRFIEEEIKEGLKNVGKIDLKNLIIAYEPVWAVGKSACCGPKDIKEMSLFIKKILADTLSRDIGLKVPIIYGGSVDTKNAGDIIRDGGVDGLLVGRTSLNAEKFVEMLNLISK